MMTRKNSRSSSTTSNKQPNTHVIPLDAPSKIRDRTHNQQQQPAAEEVTEVSEEKEQPSSPGFQYKTRAAKLVNEMRITTQ